MKTRTDTGTRRRPFRALLRARLTARRVRRSEDGVAAIEFAILAVPFFLLVFAIIETCVAYAAEQVLDNAVDAMGRQLRTGQITFETGRPTDLTEAEFRTAFCERISVLLSCEEGQLYLDVREFNEWRDIPSGIPRQNGQRFGDLDTSGFAHEPGAAGSINMVRAYYRWKIVTDLIRPHITNIRPGGGAMPTDYLIVGTAAFRNEAY